MSEQTKHYLPTHKMKFNSVVDGLCIFYLEYPIFCSESSSCYSGPSSKEAGVVKYSFLFLQLWIVYFRGASKRISWVFWSFRCEPNYLCRESSSTTTYLTGIQTLGCAHDKNPFLFFSPWTGIKKRASLFVHNLTIYWNIFIVFSFLLKEVRQEVC